MFDFGKVKVGDIAEVKSGKRLPKGHRLSSDMSPYPYIRLVDIADGRIQDENLQYLSGECREVIKRYVVNTDDICLAIVGHSIGMVFYVEEKYDNVNLTENAARITNVDNSFNPRFIYYYLISAEGQNEIISRKVGSAQGKLPLYNIKSLELPNIPRQIQDSIVATLDSISFKIELNRQTNQTLEQIAQAIFKSWFVDFEPTRAKIQAKKRWQALNDTTETSSPTCYSEELDTPNPAQQQPSLTLDQAMTQAAMAAISGKTIEEVEQLSPEQQQQLKTIADLFPDSLVESELGEVPEGWEVKPFGKLLSKTIGGDWGKEEPDDKHTERVKILRGTDLPSVYSGMDEKVPARYVDPKKLSSRKLQPGDIVIEVSGGSKDQPTGRSLFLTQEIMDRLNADLEPASFCRLFRPIDIECGLMLGLHLRKIYDDGKTWQYQNQSTGISNFQTKVFLENELVVVPPGDVKQRFYETTMPLIQKMSSAENQDLTKVRDAILPKLLSGELSLATELEVLESTE